MSNSYISDGGTCPGHSRCETNEWVSWSFDTLAAGGLEDVDLPPVVSSSTLPGPLIFFDAVIADSTARSRTEYVLPVGTLVEPGELYTLSLSVTGSGRVTSSPGGIDCASTCSAAFEPDTMVTLTAEPEGDAAFSGWGGACSGTETSCSLTMSAAQSVTASFGDAAGPTRDTAWRVTEIYIATMGYAPDNEGLQYWIDQIETIASWTPETVAQSFFDQPLVQAEYPDGQGFGPFIQALYRNIFGRDADTEGYLYWLQTLQAGSISRNAMIIAMVNGGWANAEAQADMERFANLIEVGLAFAAYQAEQGIQYSQLSSSQQEQLRQIGSDLLAAVTADTATRDAAISAIPSLLGAFLR